MATINQQRQRVEQEITALVDNLDRSTMRKMQVRIKNWKYTGRLMKFLQTFLSLSMNLKMIF
jgi:hypothetical protein